MGGPKYVRNEVCCQGFNSCDGYTASREWLVILLTLLRLLTYSIYIGPYSLEIRYPQKSIGLTCQLYVTATRVTQHDELSHIRAQVAGAIEAPSSTLLGKISSGLDEAASGQDQTASTVDTWSPLLDKLKIFAVVMDKVSEVHPYLSMAWMILDAGHKTIVAQLERTARVEELGQLILSVYDIIDITGDLKMIKAQQDVISALSKQTLECGYFIVDYYKDRSKCMFLYFQYSIFKVTNLTDNLISQYEEQFKKLKTAFQEHATIGIQLVVQSIFDQVKHIGKLLLMKMFDISNMPNYASRARHQSGKQCLDGTREELLTSIRTWINNPDQQLSKMFLLTGLSGTGKSSVAHSIAEHYHGLKRLGSSFCFDRNETEKRNDKHLFSTLAVDLAGFNHAFRNALYRCIGDSPSIRGTYDLNDQVKNFILLPIKELNIVGPIVIVIDALDESANLGARYQLLKSLVSMLSELPSNFRIIITSRPEEDIVKFLVNCPHVYHQSMTDVSRESTNMDLLKYIRFQLQDELGQPLSIFQEEHYQCLVTRAEGLFQWAYVACHAIKGYGKMQPPSKTMLKEFHVLTSTASSSLIKNSTKGALDELYMKVLSQLFGSTENGQKEDNLKALKVMLGQILATYQPLPVVSFKEMHSKSTNSDIISEEFVWALSKLGALLTGVIDHSEPIRFIHTSFYDFLLDESKSGQYCVAGDIFEQHKLIAWGAINTLNDKLRFNICNFPSSYLANCNVPGLDAAIEEQFDSWLSYACQYWGMHMDNAPSDAQIQSLIIQLLKSKLLYWLEALSLLKIVNTAILTLTAITKSSTVSVLLV
ncbi:hypothetical protein FA95DRAFT_1497030 [Auriscalpium vulgare]|uniref:Uncharacterized protein n=1 Tax=Auriscalpium vulgare TaxID=40419 RepID=A0ACB8RJL2_9AGAM|nr:hypothetical protein FA95DRAFT_1497030 [Auriscalpium vulgare]